MQEQCSEVAIVGGGLCGLSLAIALKQRSVPFRIYEARKSFAELGAGINIGPNTLATFKLIDTDLAASFQHLATRNPPGKEDVWMHVRFGAERDGHCDAELLTTLMAPPTGNVTVQRNDLLQLLAEKVGLEHAVFNKKLVSLEQSTQGVALTFADGTKAFASVCIACDGIHSAVRRAILGAEAPAALPQYSGMGAYRTILSTSELQAAIGMELAQSSQVLVGPRGYVIMYPVDLNRKVNVGLWPWRKEPWTKQEWVIPHQRAAMEQHFADWGETVHKIMDLAGNPSFYATHHHAVQPSSFVKGRVCLIGDAAHSMPPHQGAGAGQAMEDAYVVGELLSRLDWHESCGPSQAGVDAALHAYETVRRPRAQRVLESSHDAMHLWSDLYDEPLTEERLDRFIQDAKGRFAWIWHEDIAAQAKKAVNVMADSLSKV